MKKNTPCLLLCLLLQGCVGGGIIESHTGSYNWRDLSTKTNAVIYDSLWLETKYGKPTSVITHGAEEIWTYRSGRIWAGVIPVIIVPIPLAVPVGREETVFVIREGHIVSATKSEQETVGGAVGFGFGPCGGTFGVFSLEGFPK